MIRRRDWPVYPLLVGVAAWYAVNLGGSLDIDEVVYVRTASAFLEGNPYLNPTHLIAPTAKYFMSVGLVLADDPVGARAVTATFGVVTIYLVYRLGDSFRGRAVGFVAAALVAGVHFFGKYAVRAMLDVPLSCFFVASLYAALRWHRERRLWALTTVGVFAALSTTTKAYGFLYAAPPVLFVAGCLWRERGWRALQQLRYLLAGGVAVLAAVYSPYVFVPHPPVEPRFGAAISAVLSLPVVGNFAYVVGAFLVRNVLHASSGHAVEVGATVYQYPPPWTYGYWLFDRGGLVYSLALVVTLVGSGVAVLRHRAPEAALLGVSFLLPFGILSLVTVKFPRYILPLFPLLAVGLAYYGAWFADGYLLDRAVGPFGSIDHRAVVATLLVALVLAAAAPPSPYVASVREPIRTDTQYGEVATFVEQRAEATDGELVVLTYSGSIRIGLEYYLESHDAVRLRHFQLSTGFNESQAAASRRALTAGEIDVVVWQARAPQATPSFDRFVRTGGTLELSLPQSPGENRLLVYTFDENRTADRSVGSRPLTLESRHRTIDPATGPVGNSWVSPARRPGS